MQVRIRIVLNAITETSLEHESEENGSGYNWSSGTVDIDAADTVLLIKNDSDTNLHIECVKIANGSLSSAYLVHLPTTEVTVTGSTVTGTNLNTTSSNVADATAASDETNNSQGNVLATVFLAADSNNSVETPGLILGKNKSVAVDVVNNVVESAVSIIGHFED